MPDRSDTVTLVRAALAGLRDAFAELARRYRGAAFAVAYHPASARSMRRRRRHWTPW